MFKKDRWSPLVVGALIAALGVFSWVFFHHTLGTSTTFVRLAAAFWSVVDPQHLEASAYYRSYLDHNAWINWQFASVVGIFIGAYLASRTSKSGKVPDVPPIWSDRWGNSKIKRNFAAFLGGVIILFGARLAGGCTSGHVISGGMQLALSGWLFMIGLFAAGIPTAYLMYRRK